MGFNALDLVRGRSLLKFHIVSRMMADVYGLSASATDAMFIDLSNVLASKQALEPTCVSESSCIILYQVAVSKTPSPNHETDILFASNEYNPQRSEIPSCFLMNHHLGGLEPDLTASAAAAPCLAVEWNNENGM